MKGDRFKKLKMKGENWNHLHQSTSRRVLFHNLALSHLLSSLQSFCLFSSTFCALDRPWTLKRKVKRNWDYDNKHRRNGLTKLVRSRLCIAFISSPVKGLTLNPKGLSLNNAFLSLSMRVLKLDACNFLGWKAGKTPLCFWSKHGESREIGTMNT